MIDKDGLYHKKQVKHKNGLYYFYHDNYYLNKDLVKDEDTK